MKDLTEARSAVVRIKDNLAFLDILVRDLDEALTSAERLYGPAEAVPLPPHRI